MKRFVLAVVAAGLLVAAANAEGPYYVRGIFGDWGTTYPMNDDGDGSYSLTIDTSGATAGDLFQFKCANEDWSENAPPDNAQLRYIDGGITFHFYPNFTDDGWMPPTAWWAHRIGWNTTCDWELMGSPNGWAEPLATMTNMGSDLFMAEIVIPTAGSNEFKFRAAGDWEINIGNTFKYNDFNITVDTATDNELWRFELDLPNGRWRTTFVPEPASLALMVLGLLVRRR